MINQDETYQKIIQILENNNSTYKLFNHKTAFTYEEIQAVQKETGFFGAEGKCLVVKTKDSFVVCITIQGKKLNFPKLKEVLGDKDLRLAKPKELKEYFGAEPGCVYPFGFDKNINIYVDNTIYSQEWFLFSPLFPTKTVQIKGEDLVGIFSELENTVEENNELFI